MKLIIGGAFQGKTQFAKTRFGLSEADIFRCDGTGIDFSRRCIAHLEAYTDACARENRDPAALFRENPDKWKDSVLILGDISAGVVPMDPEVRRWREENGKFGRYLAENAEAVYRVFCGLEQRIR